MTAIYKPGSGPKTLTRAGFAGTAAGKKPGAKYSGYLSYIARRRAAKLGQANADPLGQTPQSAIQQQVNRITQMYGTPMADSQIQGAAQGQLDPIIAAITKKITDQANTASGAIGANSAALAQKLAGVDYGAPYAQAKTEQASVDAALQQSLGGTGGTGLANDLSSRLAQIGDPAVAQAASGLADRGAAIGTNELASGSTNLGSLIASAAAAKEYGAKLPGIAQLSGLQDIAGVNKQAASDVGDQTAQLEAQLPQIVSSLRAEATNTRSNRAQAAAALYEALTGQNITKATAKAGLQGDQAQLDYQYANSAADAASSAASTAERTRHDLANEATAAKRAAGKPLSAADRKKALDAIDTYFYGVQPKQQFNTKTQAWMDVPGSGIPAVDYQTAIRNLVNGYGMSVEQATGLANSRYQPGVDGRPLSPAQQRQRAQTKAQNARTRAGANETTQPVQPKPTKPRTIEPARWGRGYAAGKK